MKKKELWKKAKPIINPTLIALVIWIILDFLIKKQFNTFSIIKAVIFAVVFGVTYWYLSEKIEKKHPKE